MILGGNAMGIAIAIVELEYVTIAILQLLSLQHLFNIWLGLVRIKKHAFCNFALKSSKDVLVCHCNIFDFQLCLEGFMCNATAHTATIELLLSTCDRLHLCL